MASPEAVVDLDSRTSSVGTKRRFDTPTSESSIINLDTSSEDEGFEKPQKRMRLTNNSGNESRMKSQTGTDSEESNEKSGDQPVFQSGGASPDPHGHLDIFYNSVDSDPSRAPAPTLQQPIKDGQKLDIGDDILLKVTPESTPQQHLVANNAALRQGRNFESAEFKPPVLSALSWNKGIQGSLRTSFGNKLVHTQNQISPCSTSVLQTNVTKSPSNSDVKIEGPLKSTTAEKGQHELRDRVERTSFEIAKSVAGQMYSDARAAYEAEITLRGGRVFKYDHPKLGVVDFVLPILVNMNNERINFESARYLEHFVPLFIGLNVEKIPAMSPSTPSRAFEAFLQRDYSDIPSDEITQKVKKSSNILNFSTFDWVVKSVTGKAYNQLKRRSTHVQSSTADDSCRSDSEKQTRIESKLIQVASDDLPSKEPQGQVQVAPHSAETNLKENASRNGLRSGVNALSLISVKEQKSTISIIIDEQFRRFQEECKARLLKAFIDVETTLSTSPSAVLSDSEIGATTREVQNGAGYAARNSTSPIEPVSAIENLKEESKLDHEGDGLSLTRRYYPVTPPQSLVPRCLTCAETGHRTSRCPQLDCSLCGAHGLHFRGGCPQAQRCSKCLELGHTVAECQEKLKAISGVHSCALCNSRNHLDVECDLIWRSFDPHAITVLRVQDIPYSCYNCGSENHFGQECGIRVRPPGSNISGSYTWSYANWNRFVDTHGKSRPPADRTDYSLPPKKGLSIKGKANNPNTFHSDDEVEQSSFIGRPVLRQPRPKQIGKQHINFNPQPLSNATHSSDHYDPDLKSAHLGGPRLKGGSYGADGRVEPRNFRTTTTYRPRDDSARYGRERSFSPPPPFPIHGDSYRPPLPPGPPPSAPSSFLAPYPKAPPQAKDRPQAKGGGKNSNKKKNKTRKKASISSQPAPSNPSNASNQPAGPKAKAKGHKPKKKAKVAQGPAGG